MSVTTQKGSLLSASNEAAFDAWANVYDIDANPLLRLEERYLKCLLPVIDGKEILDAGCGTGRWLKHFSQLGEARSLYGFDSSEAMLACAREKTAQSATLYIGKLPEISLTDSSVDLALSSFTLSYVEDISTCAQEFSRVLRHDGDLFLSDIDPLTSAELGWRRSFRIGRLTVALYSADRTIEQVIQAMENSGLELLGKYPLCFGPPEFPTFQAHGKESVYELASGKPVIYILHFKKQASPLYSRPGISLRHARYVVDAHSSIHTDIRFENTRIGCIGKLPSSSGGAEIDLSGYTVFPGLVNPHDHLEFGLFPRLGNPPYGNATAWADDIHRCFRERIELHKRVPLEVRIWWGAIRNLLSGVTTVCHHNPPHPVFGHKQFPVKIVERFSWAHSLSFDSNLAETYSRTPQDQAFLVHACEGVDAESRQEYERLQQIGVIDDRTVLIHGLALQQHEIEELNLAGASIIRCPSSNWFLFNATSSFHIDRSVRRLAIGSDSPLTGVGDLLDEIAFAHRELDYPADSLFHCCAHGATQVLRLTDGEGCLRVGGPADFFAVRSEDCTPATHFASLNWRDVELVVMNGRVRLASADMWQKLPGASQSQLECLFIDGVPRWLNAPVRELFHAASEVLGNEAVCLNGRQLSLGGD